MISAAWGGLPRQVVETWFAGRYRLLITPPILAEYQAVIGRLLPDSPAAPQFLHAVYLKAMTVSSTEPLRVVIDDPSDNRFLECAVAGQATYLVSGDRHLLRLGRFRQTRIVTPRVFLEALDA